MPVDVRTERRGMRPVFAGSVRPTVAVHRTAAGMLPSYPRSEEGVVSTAGAGWYPDPSGRHALRWYDGRQWTPHAVDGRRQPVIDPLPGQAGTTADHPGPVPGAAAAPPVRAVQLAA